MEIWRFPFQLPYAQFLLCWIGYNSLMKQSWQEIHGTLCFEETMMLFCGVLVSFDRMTVTVTVPVPVACTGAVWVEGGPPRWAAMALMQPPKLSFPHTGSDCLNPSDHHVTARNSLLYLASLTHWPTESFLYLFLKLSLLPTHSPSLSPLFVTESISSVMVSETVITAQLVSLEISSFHFPTVHWSALNLALTGRDNCQAKRHRSNESRCWQEF